MTYIDDGKFRIRTFGKKERTPDEIMKNEFKINEEIGLDDYTMPNSGFANPYIICCFIDDTKLFVALFHNQSFVHKHFIYNIKEHKIDGKVTDFEIPDTSEENFPVDCFYNDKLVEIYVFYRQG